MVFGTMSKFQVSTMKIGWHAFEVEEEVECNKLHSVQE